MEGCKVERNVSGLIQIEMKGFFHFQNRNICILFIVVLSPELKYEESSRGLKKIVLPPMRIELMTFGLQDQRSATEL